MLKNIMLVASTATLLSCTAETYIEFDDISLQINGPEIDSSVGIEGQSVNGLADNLSQPDIANTFILTNSAVLSNFIKEPVTNMWHKVFINESSSGKLIWNNLAGVSWSLDIKDSKLYSGSDCPYGIQELVFEVENDSVSAILFNNERYGRTKFLE